MNTQQAIQPPAAPPIPKVVGHIEIVLTEDGQIRARSTLDGLGTMHVMGQALASFAQTYRQKELEQQGPQILAAREVINPKVLGV